MSDASKDFLHAEVPALGRTVHRVGLSANFGLPREEVRAALDRGLQYIFYVRGVASKFDQPLREAFAEDRSRYVLAGGPTTGWFPGQLRRWCDKTRKTLNTDYIDVLQMSWVGVAARWKPRMVDELVRLRDEGVARAISISIHDREKAGKLAADSPLDLMMLRYNAAHPGAERDIFPHLEGSHPTGRKAVLAYTATRWRKLLQRPKGWNGPVPEAADLYRFCLSSPYVDMVMMGPASLQQLDKNLAGLAKGPLTQDEDQSLRAFGKVVHDKSGRSFQFM